MVSFLKLFYFIEFKLHYLIFIILCADTHNLSGTCLFVEVVLSYVLLIFSLAQEKNKDISFNCTLKL